MKTFRSGFTLIEILLVFTLIMLLMVITTPLVVGVIQRIDLTSAQESLYNSLLRAQNLSRSQTYGEQWGVCIDANNSQYIIVAASDCLVSRNTAYDETISIADTITFTDSNASYIGFERLSGNVLGSQNIALVLDNGQYTKSITIVQNTGIIRKDQ